MDGGRTLGFFIEQEVRHANITSCLEGIIMLVRISDGTNASM